SDEDVSWGNGMAYDPRNQQYDLTNDNIGWCEDQMAMGRDLYKRLDWRFPRQQAAYDDLRTAFGYVAGQYGRCATIVSRYVGGEYVSRSLRGDRNAALPLSAIPRSTQARAFKVLEKNLFSADAWNISPRLLREMVTQYRYDDWNGNFAARHDIAVESIASRFQMGAINRMFLPTTLQRLDDMSMKYKHGETMDIADLFTWMQSAVYDDVGKSGSIPLVRRNLQRNYAALLTRIANQPLMGTPADAQALARYQLGALHSQLQAALRKGNGDLLTRAHLASLENDVQRALSAQTVLPLGRT
ncbi:MAG: zinc-dependent metalloprotease, partial [Candidatus Eremiobacteraeota bacterium]|nr:zinc-dependent metalloprotease [Candidatus Eremiobacteraeota bacterium]